MAGAPSSGGVRVVVAGQAQPVVRIAGAPFPDPGTDALSHMCIHGICHNLSAMPGLRAFSPPERARACGAWLHCVTLRYGFCKQLEILVSAGNEGLTAGTLAL
jgi:hypothetical protein